MSFFNESSACQASSNPLSKVVDTTTNERHNVNGYNNFQSGRSSQIQNNLSRFQNVDNSVQHEYNNFSSSGQNFHLNDDFSLHDVRLNEPPQSQVQQANVYMHSQSNNWVSDFRSFSLSDASPQLSQQHQNQQSHQSQQLANHPLSSMHIYGHQMQSPNLTISANHLSLDAQHQQNRQSSTNLMELNNEFDNAFSEVENEINIASPSQNQSSKEEEESNKVVNEEEDKVKFAILAQNVFNIMNNTPKHVSSNTSNKFKKSGFMQLMNKISNREIEISNDRKKLVDQNGNDIRSDLSNPLSNLQMNDILESPFDSAIKVSQTTAVKVDSNSWQGDFV